MKNSITEIVGLITRSFEENFEKMLTEKKDISEFVIEVTKTMDQVGTVLAKEALEMMDSLVKCDSRRKQNWYVHEKSAPNTLATIFGEVHYQRTYYKKKFWISQTLSQSKKLHERNACTQCNSYCERE